MYQDVVGVLLVEVDVWVCVTEGTTIGSTDVMDAGWVEVFVVGVVVVGNGVTDVDPVVPGLVVEVFDVFSSGATSAILGAGGVVCASTGLLLIGPPITPSPYNKAKASKAKAIKIPTIQQQELHKGSSVSR